MSSEAHEYDESFVAGLQWIWGEGFLSPGGPEEVAALLEGTPLQGLRVLDIGAGLGGATVLLVERHAAASVVGIDIEPLLVERARQLVASRGLGGRVEMRHVEPGPLDFRDGEFDVVFSKDAIIHVEHKAALYREVHRVLRAGGVFVGSDWLGSAAPPSPAMREWLAIAHLSFAMLDAAATQAELESAGFADVRMRDRNAWYRGEVHKEIEAASGAQQAALAARIGAESAAQRLASSRAKLAVVESGELRPTHFRAVKAG